LGFRVPLIVVSPFARAGYIAQAQYSYGSILRFIEDNWGLGRLGTTDQSSADFVPDFFDFKQNARAFHPIDAPYSKPYFLDQAPSGKPVDDD
jgi:phospholipase C